MTQSYESTLSVRPIGHVQGGRSDPDETDHWGGVVVDIVVDADRFGPGSLVGLADFSHVEVVFVFDRMAERDDYTVTRPGRGRADLPAVGVFCDRGPRRPNRLGTTLCAVVGVDGSRLTVRGLDALDGSPVLDLKPVMRQLLPAAVQQPDWVDELMRDYVD